MTLRLGITLTLSCAQGARELQLGLPKTSQWQVSTERIVAEYIDVYELAEQIVSQLEAHTAQIKDAIAELDLTQCLRSFCN